MDYYLSNRPRRLSWPCWLTDSGHFTHKVVTRPDVSLAQDGESSPARAGGLTNMPCHQRDTINEFAVVIVCLCGYAGIFFAAGVLGPVLAFICGGLLLQLYTHFDTIDTSMSVYI